MRAADTCPFPDLGTRTSGGAQAAGDGAQDDRGASAGATVIHAEPVDHGPDLCPVLRRDGAQPEPPRKGPLGNQRPAAISGAVGTFANIDPPVEEPMCQMAGPSPPSRSRPRYPRDRHAVFSRRWACRQFVENVATKIRTCQRTEVSGGRRVLLERPEGQLRHAAQAQPVADGKPHGDCTHGFRSAVDSRYREAPLWHESRHFPYLGWSD